jgi:formylglycine-generating enzyme required for sulfatase activity
VALRIVSLLVVAVLQTAVLAADPPQVLTNSLGMKLVKIPAGEFVMGSPETEEGHNASETQHRVRITKPFYLGQHEVTVGHYRKFAEATGHKSGLEREGKAGFGYEPELKAIEILTKFTWKNTGFGTDEHPVVNLHWDDAQAFCKWLSEKEKETYLLPTEALWEYACRAGTKTRYFTGDEEDSLKGFANISDAAFKEKYVNASWSIEWNDGHPFTAPVGSLKPNAWGLYDMHGNAWEWCADWYAEDYAKDSPVDDPPGPKTGEVHVVRGGAFTNRNRWVRSADRDSTRPGFRYNFTGFRVVRVIP